MTAVTVDAVVAAGEDTDAAYLSRHNLTDVFETLMGLVLDAKPIAPLPFLADALNRINGDTATGTFLHAKTDAFPAHGDLVSASSNQRGPLSAPAASASSSATTLSAAEVPLAKSATESSNEGNSVRSRGNSKDRTQKKSRQSRSAAAGRRRRPTAEPVDIASEEMDLSENEPEGEMEEDQVTKSMSMSLRTGSSRGGRREVVSVATTSKHRRQKHEDENEKEDEEEELLDISSLLMEDHVMNEVSAEAEIKRDMLHQARIHGYPPHIEASVAQAAVHRASIGLLTPWENNVSVAADDAILTVKEEGKEEEEEGTQAADGQKAALSSSSAAAAAATAAATVASLHDVSAAHNAINSTDGEATPTPSEVGEEEEEEGEVEKKDAGAAPNAVQLLLSSQPLTELISKDVAAAAAAAAAAFDKEEQDEKGYWDGVVEEQMPSMTEAGADWGAQSAYSESVFTDVESVYGD